jgi:nucleoside-diphosphate-sugar epimerase
MRVFLTGAAGFVGRYLAPALAARGHEVIATDLRGAALDLDIRDRPAVIAAIAAAGPEAVVHAGAISGPMLAADDPALMFDVNAAGTVHVLEAMRLRGVRRLVHVSSVAVYRPREDRDPVSEHSAKGSTETYGASKVAAEAAVEAYSASFGLDAWMLRVSSIYGPGRITPYLISELIEAGRSGGRVRVTGEGTNHRQFVHVLDVVEAIAAALERPPDGCVPVNISGGTYVAEEAIGRMVQRLLPRLELDVVADKGPPGDGAIGPLDLARARWMLGYEPRIGLEEGLAALIG